MGRIWAQPGKYDSTINNVATIAAAMCYSRRYFWKTYLFVAYGNAFMQSLKSHDRKIET